MQPFSACTAGMLAWNSLRIASRMPGLAVMIATIWIMCPLSLGDALKDAVMPAGQLWANFCRPVAIGAGFLPGRTLHHLGRIELVDRQVTLDTWNDRVLEPVACGGAHAGHLRQHRKMLGVVDAVELGLVLGGDIQLHNEDVGHDDHTPRVRRFSGRCCAAGLSYAAGSWVSIPRDRRPPARPGC